MRDPLEDDTELARDLSLFDITMIGVGAMIGAGIFVLTGLAAGQAGPALVMSFAFNGFVTIFTAMVYAELGSAIPESGGGYAFVRETLGRAQAFLAGWMSWFAHAVAGSLYILGFGSFVGLLVTEYFGIHPLGLGLPTLQKAFAVFAGLLFTYINYRGAKETGLAGNIVTMLKVSVIGLFILFGLAKMWGAPGTVDRFVPFTPQGYGGVFIAMGLTFIAFEGYEIIVQSGEEVVNPRETVPKAVFYSMSIVVTIYILVSIVLLGAVDVTPALLEAAEQAHAAPHGPALPPLPEDPAVWQVLGHVGELGLARAADQVLPMGTLVILVAGIFSTLSALNATTFSSSRVSFAMGRDHLLPTVFERVHSENRTPWVATVFSGALIIGMAVALPIGSVAAATDVMFLLLFLQVNYAAIVLRREHGDELDYGYLMPWFPYVPIIGILTKLFLAVYLFNYSPLAWYGALAWILAGIGIFFLYSRSRIHAELADEELRVVAERRSPARAEDQILVPIANPDHAPRLVRRAARLARARGDELLLTTIVEVPPQTPLTEGEQFIEDEHDLLEEAAQHVPDDVPSHRTVTIGHEVGKSVVHLARSRDSDLVLMGWRGQRKEARDLFLGETIDTVVQSAPCDVAVTKLDGELPDRVVVPVAGGPHNDLAVEVAAASVTDADDPEVVLLRMVDPGEDHEEARAYLEGEAEELPEGTPYRLEVIEGEDVAQGILDVAQTVHADAIVVGAAEEGLVQQYLFGAIPERIGEAYDGEVVMVRTRRPVVGWLQELYQRYVAPRRDRTTGNGAEGAGTADDGAHHDGG